MSIVVSVKVYDGVVLGADSMTTLTSKDQHGNIALVKTYSHAQKLFEVKDVPAGVLTYGIGNIGGRSVESHITDFVNQPHKDKNHQWKMKSIAQSLLGFLRGGYFGAYESVPEERRPTLGAFVAGYSSDSPVAEEWEFTIPQDKRVRKAREDTKFGASWRGVTLPFTRLYTGIDPRAYDRLKESGASEDMLNRLKKVHESLRSAILFDGMPIQDAIEFAKFILATTVGMAGFEVGIASCGGPLDIAVVRRTEPYFCWIQSKNSVMHRGS